MRRVGHRFHAAYDIHAAFLSVHPADRIRNRRHAGQADIVQGHRGHGSRDTGTVGRLPRGILSLARLNDLRHQHFIRLQIGMPPQQLRHRGSTQFDSGEVRKHPFEPAERRSHAIDQYELLQ
jgi:hypothetical protein